MCGEIKRVCMCREKKEIERGGRVLRNRVCRYRDRVREREKEIEIARDSERVCGEIDRLCVCREKERVCVLKRGDRECVCRER